MKYYKLLFGNKTKHSSYEWDLSGKWMSVSGTLKLCWTGFHVMREKDIINWIECGFDLYEVKIGKEKIIDNNKICVRKVRVIKKVDKYNRQSFLDTVIYPTVGRAKKYAANATNAANAAAAADDAAYAAYDANAANYAANAADAANYAANAAKYAAAAAYAAYAAYAANAAAYAANSADAAYAAVDGERKNQIKDLKKLLK